MNAKMVAAIVIASAITTTVLLAATASAYSTGFIPPKYHGIRIVTVPDLSKFPVYKPLNLIDPDEGKPKYINETTNIVFPPTPAPTPTPTTPEEPEDMEFWRWIEDHSRYNSLCPFKPTTIDIPTLCPWATGGGDWRIFVP